MSAAVTRDVLSSQCRLTGHSFCGKQGKHTAAHRSSTEHNPAAAGPKHSRKAVEGQTSPTWPASVMLTEAASADACTAAIALGALHKLVVVLGALAAECAPLARAAAHVACKAVCSTFA